MKEKVSSARYRIAGRVALVTTLVLTLALMVVAQVGAQGPVVYPEASGVHDFPKEVGELPPDRSLRRSAVSTSRSTRPPQALRTKPPSL